VTTLSPDLKELLSRRVESFEKVELVLALRNAPHNTLTIDELAASMHLPREILRRLVVDLRSSSLVDHTDKGAIRLTLVNGTDEAAISELATAYASDPILVMRFLSEVAMNRIRTMASRAFADAFIIGKKKGNRDDDG